MNLTPSLYALVIGIDRYDPRSRVPHLRGCVTDAEQMEHLLRDRFGVPTTHILRLTNEEATHQRIKEAFRDHLIANARRLATQEAGVGTTPAFLFHYSGHGSQAIDETGNEPDGLDETLVPYDSRTPGVYDIKDWEIGALIDELNRYSDNVTIVLDCCHSGSGTRDIQSALTRRCDPDLRPQPPSSQRPNTIQRTRAVSAGDWELSGNHVLLAGCRDKEESHEYAVIAGGRRYWQGAMSYFLQQELRQLSATRSITYRELFERVRHAVNKTYANQMPQLEGDIDREVFGGLRPARDAFYNVLDRRDGLIWIDGGVAHGLTGGSELVVFPPETRTRAEAGMPLATLRIVEEGAVSSGCEIEEPNTIIPLHARCSVHRLNAGSMQRRVQIHTTDESVRDALTARLQSGHAFNDVSPWLRVVGPQDAADLRVVQTADGLELQDNGGTLQVAAFAPEDLEGVANDLAHLARYANALELRNAAPSELMGAVSLAIKKLGFDEETQSPRAVDFPRTAGGEPVIESGERVVLEVTNHSDQPLYFALFDFAPDRAIAQLYPNIKGAHEALKPGGVFQLGLTNRRRDQLMASLPDGYVEATERFKVIATVNDTNFELLQQGPLKSPFSTRAVTGLGIDAYGEAIPPSALDQLLGRAMNGNQRAFGAPTATVADEWTTAELSVLVTTPATEMSQPLPPGARTTLATFDITIETPAAFTGTVRVLTEQQAGRAAEVATISSPATPPGLAAHSDLFVPVALGNRRSALPLGTVLELEADDDARAMISPAAPLTVHLDWADRTQQSTGQSAQIFVVAADGDIFYPVGRSVDNDAQTVMINWLPTTTGDSLDDHTASASNDLAERRSLGRTLKLYFYKVAGWEEATLGLHRVQFVEDGDIEWLTLAPGEFLRELNGGALHYRPIDASTILPRERVAVAVHGFSADTKTLGYLLTRVLPQHGIIYDHVLAYDYESLATGVSENGRKLADALRALEVDVRPRVRVDLFAHSMGSLVTRAMIEQWGGDSFVNRCFLAGPPNLGTRLADAKIFVPWLTSLAINSVGGWAPAIIAEWALGKLEADAVGVEDLRPSSTILADLNNSTKPIYVNYYVLAGNNPLWPQANETVLQRLKRHFTQGLDLALDTIFDDQNDMIINVRSMLGLRNGTYPAHLIQEQEVPCDHFSYFSNPTAQETLLRWLR